MIKRQQPKNIYIETTNFCNAKCTMCPNEKMSREKGFMSFETFEHIVRQLKSVSLEEATVYLHKEGEPLLDKDLVERIQLLKSELPRIGRVALNTNASLLTPEIAVDLIESGLDTLFFSLDSIVKTTYEKKRIGLSFESVLRNIENFIQENEKRGNPVHIVMQMLVDDSNRNETDLYKKKWDQTGVEVFIKEMHNYLDMELSSLPLPETKVQVKACPDPFDTIVIHWNGRVGACCWDYDNIHQMGTIFDDDVVGIFNNHDFKNLRQKMTQLSASDIEPCSDCSRILGTVGIKGMSSEDGWISR